MYFEELKRTMEWLGNQKESIFLGQAVRVPGTAMSNTLKEISGSKLIEMPVAEEMQMGVSIGLALDGYVPISIYPRWNFLLLTVNQLVNHLDRMNKISNYGYSPKVIIRTAIGSQKPLHPQYQHVGDFTGAFRLLCENINVVRLEEPRDIFPAYKEAFDRSDQRSTILVEYGDYYNEK